MEIQNSKSKSGIPKKKYIYKKVRSGKTRHVIFNHPTLIRIFRNIAVCTIVVYGLSPHNVLITMTMDIDEVRAEAKCDDVEEFKDGAKDDNISSRKRTTSQACMEMIAMMEAQKRESEELKKMLKRRKHPMHSMH